MNTVSATRTRSLAAAFDQQRDSRPLYAGGTRQALRDDIVEQIRCHMPVVLLTGQAKVGKTRLLDAVLAMLADDPVRIVRAAGADIPALLAEKQGAARGTAPTLIVLDDADAVDARTWEMLLARAGGPIQVLMAGSSDFLDKAANAAGRLIDSGDLAHRELEPLSSRDIAGYVALAVDESTASLREVASEEALAELLRESGGMPARIDEVLAAAVAIAGCREQDLLTLDVVEDAISSLAPAPPIPSAALAGLLGALKSTTPTNRPAPVVVAPLPDEAALSSNAPRPTVAMDAATETVREAVADPGPAGRQRRSPVRHAVPVILVAAAGAGYAYWTLQAPPAPIVQPDTSPAPAQAIAEPTRAEPVSSTFVASAPVSSTPAPAAPVSSTPAPTAPVSPTFATVEPPAPAEAATETPLPFVQALPDSVASAPADQPPAIDSPVVEPPVVSVAEEPAPVIVQPIIEPAPAQTATEQPSAVESADAAPPSAIAPDRVPVAPAPVSAPLAEATAPREPVAAEPAPPSSTQADPTIARLPPAVVDGLLRRGASLLEGGDVLSARLLFERAAWAGNGQGATGVGKTYDPAFLAAIDVQGVSGNPERAASWYRKAVQLGDADAAALLRALPQGR